MKRSLILLTVVTLIAATGAAVAQVSDGMAPRATDHSCFGQSATIVGTDEDDTLEGTPGDDVIWAGPGNDVVHGRGGNDIICLGTGADEARGGKGRDRIFGHAGADVIYGGPLRDILVGGRGDDTLFGNRGRDVLRGGVGIDSGNGGPGTDACLTTETATDCEDAGVVQVDIGDAGGVVTVAENQILVLRLEANPTTGYRWVVLESGVVNLTAESHQPHSDLVGSGGITTFSFTPTAVGRAELRLGYLRPWEDGAAPIDEYSITVNVTE
jgi:predicted secreted protein